MNKKKDELRENEILEQSCESEFNEDGMKEVRPGAFEINMKDSIVRGSIAKIDLRGKEFIKQKKEKPQNDNDENMEIYIGSNKEIKVEENEIVTEKPVKKIESPKKETEETKKVVEQKFNNENYVYEQEAVIETSKKEPNIEATKETKNTQNRSQVGGSWDIDLSNSHIAMEVHADPKKFEKKFEKKSQPKQIAIPTVPNDSWNPDEADNLDISNSFDR